MRSGEIFPHKHEISERMGNNPTLHMPLVGSLLGVSYILSDLSSCSANLCSHTCVCCGTCIMLWTLVSSRIRGATMIGYLDSNEPSDIVKCFSTKGYIS